MLRKVLPAAALGGSRGLATSAKLYVNGSGLFGALGLGDSLKDAATYTRIPLMDDLNIVKVSAGWGHSAALGEDGRVYVWGRCFDFPNLFRLNRIGYFSSALARFISRTAQSKHFGLEDQAFHPAPVCLTGIENAKDVACSAGMTIVVTEGGQVYGWGVNDWQQCSAEANTPYVRVPKLISVPSCSKVELGLQHVLALTHDGELFGWGKCSRGQLGGGRNGDELKNPGRVVIKSPEGRSLRVTAISAGFTHSAAITEDGAVYVWGKQMSLINKSETGIGAVTLQEDEWIPRRVDLPHKAVEICSSSFATTIRTEDNSLWVMGLGELDRNMNPKPLRVTLDVPGTDKEVLIEPFFMSSKGMLRKGHGRVFVHSPGTEGFAEDRNLYEVVLHKGEAYCLPWSGLQHLPEELQTGELDVVDHSAGWKHNLLLVRA